MPASPTYRVIQLTAGGGTVNLSAQDGNVIYFLISNGAITLTSSWTIQLDPAETVEPYAVFKIIYCGNVTLSGNNITIFGQALNQAQASTDLLIHAVYNLITNAYCVSVLEEFVRPIPVGDLTDASITNAKLATLAQGSIKIGDAAARPVDLSIATSGRILVGNGTTATSVAVSGDATLTAGGALTIANNAVTTVKILDANVTTAKIADAAVTPAKISRLDYRIDAVITATGTPASTMETTLATVAIAANTLTANEQSLHVLAYGTTAANANAKTIRLNVSDPAGVSVVSTNTTTAAPNNLNWIFEAQIIRIGATDFKGFCKITFGGVADEIDIFSDVRDWAQAMNIYLTGQNGVAAANDIVLQYLEVNLVK